MGGGANTSCRGSSAPLCQSDAGPPTQQLLRELPVPPPVVAGLVAGVTSTPALDSFRLGGSSWMSGSAAAFSARSGSTYTGWAGSEPWHWQHHRSERWAFH